MASIESVLPPLVAVVVAIVSRRVTFSLFAGIWLGGIIAVGGNPVSGLDRSFDWMVEVVTDAWNARFLLLVALLGSGAALMYKIGGSHAVARMLAKRVATAKQAQLLTYALGLVIFFNDYINTVIVGNTTRSITGHHRVSREKLSYIIDSTSAPIACVAPISDWIGYQVGLIAAAFVTLSIVDANPYATFLASIPWNFYCILAIAAVPMIILLGDYGPMARAEARARTTGKLVADGDVPLSNVDNDLGAPFKPETAHIGHFIIPLVVLIGTTIWAIWLSAGGSAATSIEEVLAGADISYALLWGAFAMTACGLVLARIRGMNSDECERVLLQGFHTMLPALVIMVLAWTVAAACNALDTAGYIVSVTESWMTPGILPILVFVIAGAISFATGTSWGTMAILTPIAIPVVYSLNAAGGDALPIPLVVGAIFSGAIFGDHCSPISDTTVMSSIFSGSDHIAHVRTQIPYALVPASISGVLFLLSNVVSSALPLLLAGLIVQFLVLRFLGRPRPQVEVGSDGVADSVS